MSEEIFAAIDWLVDNLFDPSNPDDLRYYPNNDILGEYFGGNLADIWEAWEAYKNGVDRIDFAEQLQAAYAARASPGTPILVVDEYHDATPLMARVVEMWIKRADIVIVCGDPHQVVNQYQGASPYFFERLEDEYDLPKILLDKSWRVGSHHWRGATRLLAEAHTPPPVEPTGVGAIREYNSGTFANSKETGWQVPLATSEGSPAWIVNDVSDGTGVDPDRSILFLARTKVQVDGIGAALEQAGIFYRSQSDLGGWNSRRARKRRLLYNALTKIRGVTAADINRATEGSGSGSGPGPGPGPAGHGGLIGLDRWTYDDDQADDGIVRHPEEIWLSSAEASALLKHTPARGYLRNGRKATDKQCDIWTCAGVAKILVDIDEWVEPEFWAAFTHGAESEKLLIKNKRSDREREALRTALNDHSETIDPDDITVSVLTIHASKGMEGDDVVVYDGVTNRILQAMRTDEEGRKNEWRTWYVALTRARETLHIMRGGFRWTTPIIPTDIRAVAQGIDVLEVDQ
jgi:DNA helicase-2/ATP-dependent DNA helicase PcrA